MYFLISEHKIREFLDYKSAAFVVNCRENCKMSQEAVKNVMENTTNLVDNYLSSIIVSI